MLGVLAQNVGAGKERDQGRGESIKRGGNRVVLINRVFLTLLSGLAMPIEHLSRPSVNKD